MNINNMKKSRIQMKNNFRKKPLRRLTCILQKTKTHKNTTLGKGFRFAIKSLSHGTLNSKQIEVCRIFLRRAAAKTKKQKLSRNTKISIRTYLNKFFTKKSSHQRMGKGKGSVKGTFSTVYPGKIIFEAKTGKLLDFLKAFKNVKDRLSFRVGIFSKNPRGFYYKYW